jgi:hypothetical protein
MVEGKGFVTSPLRLSAYLADIPRRQTAVECPVQPFRVLIRPHFPRVSTPKHGRVDRRCEQHSGCTVDLNVDGSPLWDGRGWTPLHPLHVATAAIRRTEFPLVSIALNHTLNTGSNPQRD